MVLQEATTDYIEVRVCRDWRAVDEDVAVEIYVVILL